MQAKKFDHRFHGWAQIEQEAAIRGVLHSPKVVMSKLAREDKSDIFLFYLCPSVKSVVQPFLLSCEVSEPGFSWFT